jgi:hypothetical protein
MAENFCNRDADEHTEEIYMHLWPRIAVFSVQTQVRTKKHTEAGHESFVSPNHKGKTALRILASSALQLHTLG